MTYNNAKIKNFTFVVTKTLLSIINHYGAVIEEGIGLKDDEKLLLSNLKIPIQKESPVDRQLRAKNPTKHPNGPRVEQQ